MHTACLSSAHRRPVRDANLAKGVPWLVFAVSVASAIARFALRMQRPEVGARRIIPLKAVGAPSRLWAVIFCPPFHMAFAKGSVEQCT